MGEMRSGQKADLVKCLEKVCKETTETPIIEATVLDGAVIVQMLGPRTATTFQEYIDMIFKPFMLKQLETVKRVDIVWDVYKPDSLKKGAREKRGIGIRRRVLPSTRIPSNWHSFLRVDDNKEELFHLLAEQSVLIHVEGKELYSTYEEKALCSSERHDLSNLEPCTQEEADTRILLHVLDASLSGHRKIMIRTIDTDVVVLAISIFHVISVDELWISYGTGRNFRYLAIHEIATKLGQERSRALPLFHAITGCDTVSFFAGRGKKTAWEIWNVCPDLTNVLVSLSSLPLSTDDVHASMTIIERFVILLYDRTSVLTEVDNARQELFPKSQGKSQGVLKESHQVKRHLCNTF
ncbi:hypothetical protein QZH41_015294 [Actinostola sp. cb2023]|nr:hypothetical protein QZH41_015294 [Actinostola sp. cb2023]